MSPLFRGFLIILAAVILGCIIAWFSASVVNQARAAGTAQAEQTNAWYCHDYPERC